MSLTDSLNSQVPLPQLSPQEYVLNAFKSYCSFNQVPYETHLEALSSQLDRCADEPFSINTRRLSAESLSYNLLCGFTHSALLGEINLFDIKLNEEDIFSIVECCKTCPNLRGLRLHNVGTFPEIGNILTRAHKVNSKLRLEKFRLEFCKLNDKGFRYLASSLENTLFLSDLSLIGLGLPGARISKLLAALPRATPLRRLDLSRNDLGSKGTKALVSRFNKDQDLHTLCLDGCNLDADELLNNMKNTFLCLKSLDLSNNSFSQEQGLQLSSLAARRKSLTEIIFVKCSLEDLTIAAICASMLKKSQCEEFVKINLSQNLVGVETAVLIASVMAQSEKHTSRLEELKLNYCELGHEGMGYILRYCTNHPNLKVLQLNRNVRIDDWDKGQHSVSEGLITVLNECTKLEVLCIRGDAPNGYAIRLDRFMQSCQHTALKSLDIASNAIKAASSDLIKQIILENTTLRELYWDDNNLTQDNFVSMTHAISQNPCLQLVEFPVNDFSNLVKQAKGDDRKLENLRRVQTRFLQTRFINKHHQGFYDDPIYRKKEMVDRVSGLPDSLPVQIVRKHFRRNLKTRA